MMFKKIAVMLGCAGLFVQSAYTADSDYLLAEKAYFSKDVATLLQLEQLMQGELLAIYPTYFRLYLNLRNLTPNDIAQFAQMYPNTALLEKLAADYAEQQAAVGAFQDVVQVAQWIQSPDDDETCAIAAAQAMTGKVSLLQSIKTKIWYDASDKRSAPCQQAANVVDQLQLYSPQELQYRLWFLLGEDQLTRAVAMSPRLGMVLTFDQLVAAKRDALTLINNSPLQSAEQQAEFIVALASLARQSADTAGQLLDMNSDRLPQPLKLYAYRVVAMHSMDTQVSSGFNRKTMDWFKQSMAYPFNAVEADAYARQAIRYGEWENVLHALDVMSAKQKEETIWQYWFARASEQRKDDVSKQLARQFYTYLAGNNDYYGLLARARLGIRPQKFPDSYTPSAIDRQRLSAHAHFSRAFRLKELSADKQFSNREWNWAVRVARMQYDDALIIAAAEKAAAIEWYDRAIYAADRTQALHSFQLRFLTPYRDQVEYYSQSFGADPAWVFGLMRQESRFSTAARSHVGASGLMQLMPATARWVANRLGEPYSGNNTYQTETNIRWGTYYINHIYNELGNQPVLATAGYNAGPNRARRWQPQFSPLSADQYTESIPFLETRDYVKQVMTNATFYGLLFGNSQQNIIERMGMIPVREPSN